MEEKSDSQADMEVLVDSEETVGRLYELYAKAFPEHENFWMALAVEEADHASAALDLIGFVNEGNAAFLRDSLPLDDVEKLRGEVQEQLEHVERKDITFMDALNAAREVEKTMVEGAFYRAFEGERDDVRGLLEYLDGSSKRHLSVVELEIERYKKA